MLSYRFDRKTLEKDALLALYRLKEMPTGLALAFLGKGGGGGVSFKNVHNVPSALLHLQRLGKEMEASKVHHIAMYRMFFIKCSSL